MHAILTSPDFWGTVCIIAMLAAMIAALHFGRMQ